MAYRSTCQPKSHQCQRSRSWGHKSRTWLDRYLLGKFLQHMVCKTLRLWSRSCIRLDKGLKKGGHQNLCHLKIYASKVLSYNSGNFELTATLDYVVSTSHNLNFVVSVSARKSRDNSIRSVICSLASDGWFSWRCDNSQLPTRSRKTS